VRRSACFVKQLLILVGEKTWEIRGGNINIREKIGLIESGTGFVVGECEVVDSFEIKKESWLCTFRRHQICKKDFMEMEYDIPHAWVLRNAKRYDKPIPYKHPQGAVIWVRLDN